MKKMFYLLVFSVAIIGCKVSSPSLNSTTQQNFDNTKFPNELPGDSIGENRMLNDSIEAINSDSLAKADANKYYKKFRMAGTFSILCGVYSVVGLVPATVIYFKTPHGKYLQYPSQELMNNKVYSTAYIHQAKKIKRRKVVKNYLFGLGMSVGIGALLIYAITNLASDY